MFQDKGNGEWENSVPITYPAATTTVTPELYTAFTALFVAVEKLPPRDMDMTDLVETPRDRAFDATRVNVNFPLLK